MPSDFDAYQDPAAPEEYPAAIILSAPRKKGCTVLAWVGIVLLVGLFIISQNLGMAEAQQDAQQEKLELIVFEMQARYLIGGAQLLPETRPELLEQAKLLNKGSLAQKLRYVVLAGELGGPKEALAALDQLREKDSPIRDALARLYADYAADLWHAPSLSAQEKNQLVDELGWFADLALHPLIRRLAVEAVAAPAGAAPALVLENQFFDPKARAEIIDRAKNTFAAVLITLGSACFVAFAGFIGLIVFLSLLVSGKVQGRISTGSNHGGVYAETFAIWLALFLGLHGALAVLPWHLGTMTSGALLMLGSLAALLWPVLRGIPFRQVREEIGWTGGRGPFLESVVGLACYAMSLPLLVLGLILTLILVSLRHGLGAGLADQDIPIHPIVDFIVRGDAATRVQVAILACVLAPLVEETMFRGVLYRHLRELTGSWAWLASVVASGTVVSFLFAAIHPQGLVAVPALMALAYGFTIAREWRGSLIASMIGHGVNNGLLVLFVILVLGG